MKNIPKTEVIGRLKTENPWWDDTHSEISLRRRAYFSLLYPLVTDRSVRRAVLLMGPRRVGKTVLLHHVIDQLIKDGLSPKQVCYVSVDHPLYNECALEDFLSYFREATGTKKSETVYVFFDEIQYLRNWEIHLKSLVDDDPHLRIVASGSAAAALKLKSTESGAGRFTDFLLPPLTFYEYLELLDKSNLIEARSANQADFPRRMLFSSSRIDELNENFIHYLNFGGYPEVIFSETIQNDLGRFVKSDIIDKVLLRDLPSLYGIQDIQELNSLFTSLAFNTANEVSLEELSKNSGVAKNTIKRYLEYLEAAFLIKPVHRIDRTGKRFQRANFFKVYLTNPSLRSALFSPLRREDPAMGAMAETGIYSQWFHTPTSAELRYARWAGGEVDIVGTGKSQGKPKWAVEVKWSDRPAERPKDLDALIAFCKANKLAGARVTSLTATANRVIDDVHLEFQPASIYCYTLGYNIVNRI